MFNELMMELLILISISVNYPIMKEWGLKLPKIIILIVKEGQLQAAQSLLGDSNLPALNEMQNLKELIFLLKKYSSSYAIYPFYPSRKGNEFTEVLSSFVKSGSVVGFELNTLPLIITEEYPLEIGTKNVFKIYLDADLTAIPLDKTLVIPPDEQLPVVYDKAMTVISDCSTQMEKVLLAAAAFLYPNLCHFGMREKFEHCLEIAKELVIKDEESKSTDDMGQVFVKLLYRWQEQTNFHEAYELPNLEMHVVNQIENVIIFDARYVYVKEDLFKKISQPILKIFTIDTVKDALAKEEILCKESSTAYSIKMGYYDIAGNYKRERMLRFNRDKLNVAGELEFVELCCDR